MSSWDWCELTVRVLECRASVSGVVDTLACCETDVMSVLVQLLDAPDDHHFGLLWSIAVEFDEHFAVPRPGLLNLLVFPQIACFFCYVGIAFNQVLVHVNIRPLQLLHSFSTAILCFLLVNLRITLGVSGR